MAPYILRPAKQSERELIFESYKCTVGPYIAKAWGWDESYQREEFWNHCPLEELKIVEVRDEFAGVVHVVDEEGTLHIRMIFLLPHFQNHGIGSTLIRHVQERARAEKKLLCLKVITCNPAKALYENLGFKAIDENDSLLDMRMV